MTSGYLQCIGCYASFAAQMGCGKLPDLVCTFCGESLVEFPIQAHCPDDRELAVISGPWPEEVKAAIESRERGFLEPEIKHSPREVTVKMLGSDLAMLLDDVEIKVLVSATAPSKSLTIDRWRAVLPAIEVACEDIGIDAALIGLAGKVSDRVTELLATDTPERRDFLPLLLKLWYADRRSKLGRVLEGAAVLVNWEYERDAC